MTKKQVDIAVALLINIILITLYVHYLGSDFGVTGLVVAFSLSFAFCIYVYVFRIKEPVVDATLGFTSIICMVYLLMLKKTGGCLLSK